MSFVGNTMSVGRGDGGAGAWSPEHAMVFRDCAQTVIASNTMYHEHLPIPRLQPQPILQPRLLRAIGETDNLLGG